MDTIFNLKRNEINEIFDFILTTEEAIPNFDIQDAELYEFIGFSNCVWSNRTGKVYDYSPDRICFFKLPIDFNPNAKSPVFDEFMRDITCNNEDLEKLLYEMIGFCLNPRNEKGKSFFLIGSGANGKSTFLKAVTKAFGGNNIESLDFEDLNKQFFTHKLIGKLINIGSDINMRYVSGANLFKKLVTGDSVTVDIKFQTPIKFSNCAKFIFAGNRPPRTDDTSDGFLRRIILIPFIAKFTSTDEDDKMIDKLTTHESLEYLIQQAIKGYWRMEKYGFTISESVIEMKKAYEILSNPVVEFLNGYGEKAELNEYLKSVTAAHFYKYEYSIWCDENGYKPLSSGNFSVEMDLQGFEKRYVSNSTSKKTTWSFQLKPGRR
jgi:phage/plasmid primase, P4 family, C-terminal domain